MVKTPSTNAGDVGSIPGWGRSSGEGNGNPLHSACLENPMEPSMLYSKGCKRIRHALASEQQHVCMYIYIYIYVFMYIYVYTYTYFLCIDFLKLLLEVQLGIF